MSTRTPSQQSNTGSASAQASGSRIDEAIIVDDSSDEDSKKRANKRHRRRELSSSDGDAEDDDNDMPTALDLISGYRPSAYRRNIRSSSSSANGGTPSRSALARVDSNDERARATPTGVRAVKRGSPATPSVMPATSSRLTGLASAKKEPGLSRTSDDGDSRREASRKQIDDLDEPNDSQQRESTTRAGQRAPSASHPSGQAQQPSDCSSSFPTSSSPVSHQRQSPFTPKRELQPRPVKEERTQPSSSFPSHRHNHNHEQAPRTSASVPQSAYTMPAASHQQLSSRAFAPHPHQQHIPLPVVPFDYRFAPQATGFPGVMAHMPGYIDLTGGYEMPHLSTGAGTAHPAEPSVNNDVSAQPNTWDMIPAAWRAVVDSLYGGASAASLPAGAAPSVLQGAPIPIDPSAPDEQAPTSAAWGDGSLASNILSSLGNGTVEAEPDALRQIFQSDEDAISDMANLRPCPQSAIDYLIKHGLVTPLKPHQSTALRFLIESEHRNPPTADREQKCMFKRINGRNGRHCFLNVVVQEWTESEPEMPRGCVLADAMGLGKTLSVLALIMSPADGRAFLKDDTDGGIDKKPVIPEAKGKKRAIILPDSDESEEDAFKQATKGRQQSKHLKRQRMGSSTVTNSQGKAKNPIVLFSSDDSDSDAARSGKRKGAPKKPPHDELKGITLVVCPLSVLSNWTSQANQHCPRLRVGTLYGNEGKELRAKKDWSKYDMIVTTYDTVKTSYKSIALLKDHDLREADYKERRAEITDKIEEYRELQAANIRRGQSSSVESMSRVYADAIAREEQHLVDFDAEWNKARMVAPMAGGKTDWKKEEACLARLKKLQGGAATDKRKTATKKTKAWARRSISDSTSMDAFGSDADDFDDECDVSMGGSSGVDAAMAEFFSPANFENFTDDDLLYIWCHLRRRQGQTRIFEQEWLRVVLDEAHVVRNRATQTYTAIQALRAERRVAVSGTPIVNGASDLGSLASWIGIYPFSRNPKLFAERVHNPIKRGGNDSTHAMDLLRAICKDLVCLRTKDMKVDGRPLVDLPAIEHRSYDIRLKPDDETFYARAEEALRRMLSIWMDEGGNLGARRLTCILVFLCRMRQLACDRRLVPATLIEDIEAAATEENDDGTTKKTPTQLRAILSAMVANGDDCPICMEPLPAAESPPVITPCSHVFHKECLASSLAASKKCPMDRRAIEMSKVVESSETEGEEVTDAGLGDGAKIDALIEIINNIKAAHPTDKILVFSNFVAFLKLVEKRLELEEIEHATFFGSHTRTQREETLRQFRRPLRQPTAEEAAAAAAARAISLGKAKREAGNGGGSSDLLAALDTTDFASIARLPASKPRTSSSSSKGKPAPRVLLLSIQAGGVGLNLTEASHVILTDPWWQGAIEAQAIDRAHRIGQVKPVNVYRLVSHATVEDRVVQVAKEKMQLAAEALGGLQYKGAALFKGKTSTRSKLKEIGRLFGLGAVGSGSGSGGRVAIRGPPRRS